MSNKKLYSLKDIEHIIQQEIDWHMSTEGKEVAKESNLSKAEQSGFISGMKHILYIFNKAEE